MNKWFEKVTPDSVKNFIESRFTKDIAVTEKDGAAFDLIRATVNLTVASLLISLATSLKLPLSTTYVTFMVAMGSSLADRAWGRESAVYRITGVMTVILGWFFTAFVAFVISFLVAMLLMWGGVYAIILLALGCGWMLVHNSLRGKKKKEGSLKLKMPNRYRL